MLMLIRAKSDWDKWDADADWDDWIDWDQFDWDAEKEIVWDNDLAMIETTVDR
jgi:hypothetical protein